MLFREENESEKSLMWDTFDISKINREINMLKGSEVAKEIRWERCRQKLEQYMSLVYRVGIYSKFKGAICDSGE